MFFFLIESILLLIILVFIPDVTPELQMYLLSKATKVPESFKREEFVHAMICKYLKINIDYLTADMRSKLYGSMHRKLRRFKEYHPNEISSSVSKAWLSKYVQKDVFKLQRDELIRRWKIYYGRTYRRTNVIFRK